MHRFFKKVARESSFPSSSGSQNSPLNQESGQDNTQLPPSNPSTPPSSARSHIDLNALPSDPVDRKPISHYHPNDRDEVRRAYLQKGPYQPRGHAFPQTSMSGVMRRFNESWFKEYANWLEYSIKEDAAFCLCCYLFKNEDSSHGGGDCFTSKGFKGWHRKSRFDVHIGGANSVHNQCVKRGEDLMTQKQSIQTALNKQSDQTKAEYRIRLNASIDVTKLLLRQGLPFRGHDESESSRKPGCFLTMYDFLAEQNENVKSVVLKNAPRNHTLTSPDIQKDIANSCSKETVDAILEEIDDGYFAILVDESRDTDGKEQMALVLRYVDKKGFVMERLVGIEHVTDTSSLLLKEKIYSLLSDLSLSPSRIRGQGYDGASNMRGHVNGLRSLIMQDCSSAHYIHCFAHQLQLTLVAVANTHDDIGWLCESVGIVLTVIGGSYKRRDDYREKQGEQLEEALRMGELQTGRGLNQELGLARPGDTRWGSHFKSFSNFIIMFDPIVSVLDAIGDHSEKSSDRVKAKSVVDGIQTFEFALLIHLMKLVLGITNPLSQAFQRRDQDIVNAITLLGTAKRHLQMTRDEGWDSLMETVHSFCEKHDIEIPNMDDFYTIRGKRAKRRVSTLTNEHHYRVDVFYAVIDLQLQELNNRFPETSTELLLGVACLNPIDSFSSFDKQKLLRMAQLYPDDFDESGIDMLSSELDVFIMHIQDDERFSNLKSIGDFSRKLVQTKKYLSFPHLHLLVKLALILPVSTATVERVFSAMKYIKNTLRNRISDEFLNDAVITYFEDDLFQSVDNEQIMLRFQKMKTRRGQL